MSKRIVVMISGGGTNLQALIDAIADETIKNAEIVAVISNKASAYGLTRAQDAGIEASVFSAKPYTDAGKSREAYDADLAEKVTTYAPDLIVLAGWMRILTPAFLSHFPNKVINLHPALPGQFAGINAIERAFEAYQNGEIDHSGCMVHYVIPEVDAGPVIADVIVPFEANDTLDSFSTRLHIAEHALIVKAVGLALDQN
ncbi:MAG: phosphoribosylglycinamide formyltransferase [Aggregatilineales bacterium]